MRKIKMLVIDVDGTLTDGKIYMGASGEVMKAFSVKDGLMISRLGNFEIVPVIITGRSSDILVNRCKELKITEIYQGIDNKKESLKEIIKKYQYCLEEVAYIGDDINDLECMVYCGLKGCPKDAANEVRAIADFVSSKNGGNGAVREFIEYIIGS